MSFTTVAGQTVRIMHYLTENIYVDCMCTAECKHSFVPAEAATAPMTAEGIPMMKTVPAAAKQVT